MEKETEAFDQIYKIFDEIAKIGEVKTKYQWDESQKLFDQVFSIFDKIHDDDNASDEYVKECRNMFAEMEELKKLSEDYSSLLIIEEFLKEYKNFTGKDYEVSDTSIYSTKKI